MDIIVTRAYRNKDYFQQNALARSVTVGNPTGGGGGFPSHNSLAGLQGGQVSEYYHFTAAEYTELHDWLDNVTLGSDGGMTIPANSSITGKLEITQNAPQLRLTSTGSNTGIEMLTGATKKSWFVGAQYNVDQGFEITPSTADGGTTFSTPIFVIKSDGNVGIGTSSPGYKLHIKSNAGNNYVISERATKVQGEVGIGIAGGTSGNTWWIYQATNKDDLQFNNGSDRVTFPATGGVKVLGSDVGYMHSPSDAGMYVNGLGTELHITKGILSGNICLENPVNVWDYIKHPDFTTGFQGTNWKIFENGNAEFRNVLISGGLSVYELILNRVRYQDGGLIIGAGGGKVRSMVSNVQGSEEVIFEDPEGNSIIPFTVGAIVLMQDFDLDRTTVIKKIVRQVSNIEDSTGRVDLVATTGWTPASDDVGEITIGDEIVAIGHVSDTNLDSNIYMSAVDSGAPFMRMQDGVDSYSKWNLNTKTGLKLQIGNLAGLASWDILPASPGYGLYCNNVYLTGKLVLPTAGMTDEGSASSSIRIYAGDTYANKATAKFRVTQNGDLTATGVAELGTNTGLDPESADSNNVAIKGCVIYESSRNDDVGSIYINTQGYQAGTTKYRNTFIGDGKASYLIECIGAKATIGINRVLGFSPYVTVVDYAPSSISTSVIILGSGAGASKTITLPVAADIETQFGAGKSAKVPILYFINGNSTYNMSITTVSNTDTFFYGTSNAKTYVLGPHRSCYMMYNNDDNSWYVIES